MRRENQALKVARRVCLLVVFVVVLVYGVKGISSLPGVISTLPVIQDLRNDKYITLFNLSSYRNRGGWFGCNLWVVRFSRELFDLNSEGYAALLRAALLTVLAMILNVYVIL